MKTAETYYREKNFKVGKQLLDMDWEQISIMKSFAEIVAKSQINECAKIKPGDLLRTDNKKGEIYLRQWNVEHSLLVTDISEYK